MASITSLPSGVTGSSLVLISTQTASSSATIDFTSGIDSTYKEYIFKFIDIHPATDNVSFQFQADTGTNTNYNQTITSTFFRAAHTEDDSTLAELGYQTTLDLAQGTGFQTIAANIGNDNDQHVSGTLHLFNPSSTTFVKHFKGRNNDSVYIDGLADIFLAGYFNTTSAITRVRFKMSSGNIDAGTIKMYGVV
jgi:hypothetical protein|tara:strand:+ start:202 stop:780 length:579 start_codon:yes stop_codon:yes gene_type:complete